MAKADEKGAGGFPLCMGCGRLFRCARFRLERSQVGLQKQKPQRKSL
jgi:hypothetical protein